MSLAFNSLAAVVKDQYSTLALADPRLARALHIYRSVGGGARKWSAAGIYATARNDMRWVLEVFAQPMDNLCVVRVYQDAPLKFHYARKTTGGIENASALVREAADLFRDLVPPDAKDASETEVPEELGVEVLEALAPIPPPIALNEIAEWARPNTSCMDSSVK